MDDVFWVFQAGFWSCFRGRTEGNGPHFYLISLFRAFYGVPCDQKGVFVIFNHVSVCGLIFSGQFGEDCVNKPVINCGRKREFYLLVGDLSI